MRILRLKLVNFIGIKNGMGKDEIEISFPQDENTITMLLGKNGSGKSTIVSQLTPFKDTFDDRKDPIVPGKDGLKEIDILHDGHTYLIKHIYARTPFSFITKDGLELNESGGVRTFKDVIKTEFGLTEDYFKIGKIGSNTTNFIQFTTTERKEYISMFVEPVKKYIDAFNIVSEKVKLNNKQISQVTDDLSKYDSVSSIEARIASNKTALSETESSIDSSNRKIAECDAKISEIEKALSGYDYPKLKETLLEKEFTLKENKSKSEEFEKTHSERSVEGCNKAIADLDAKISDNKSKLAAADANMSNEMLNKINISNSIEKSKAQITGKYVVDADTLKAKIETLKSDTDSIKGVLDNSKLAKSMLGVESNVPMYLDSFSNFMLLIEKYHSELNECTIIPNQKNAVLFFGKDFSDVFNENAHTVAQCLSANNECLEKKNSELASKTANLGKLDILDKRPKECRIDDCPFISDALKYKNLPEEMEGLGKEITAIKASISENSERQDKLNETNVVYSQIAKAYSNMKVRENIVFQYFISQCGNLVDAITGSLNDLSAKAKDTEDLVTNTLSCMNKLASDASELKMSEVQYQSIKESESTRSYFEKEISDLSAKLSESQSKIDAIAAQRSDLKKEADDLAPKREAYSDYENALETRDSLSSEIADLTKTISEYDAKAKEKATLSSEKETESKKLEFWKSERKRLTDETNSMAAAELSIKRLNEKMAELNSSYSANSLVKQALSPKSGIPLIFIKAYLDGTESIANDLLNIAYNGKFEIKFVPTAKDFFIQVRSGDNVIDDIKYASQGEIAMTTISLSLALIERSLGEFNILYLDEIDGPLDSGNRESFISILNKQIKKLNLEQIFVISHNNAFDECSMNLIMLPGSEERKSDSMFMKNKKIIYDATESN